jgi:hypothetical protein
MKYLRRRQFESGNLSNLQDLWLYNANLTGTIPPEL